jgi:hypothetical protein
MDDYCWWGKCYSGPSGKGCRGQNRSMEGNIEDMEVVEGLEGVEGLAVLEEVISGGYERGIYGGVGLNIGVSDVYMGGCNRFGIIHR